MRWLSSLIIARLPLLPVDRHALQPNDARCKISWMSSRH